MNRQTLVNTLLILAGIVLALALFAAGVYWRSRTGSRGGQAEPHVTRARIPPFRYSGCNALQALMESELKTFHPEPGRAAGSAGGAAGVRCFVVPPSLTIPDSGSAYARGHPS